MAAPVRWALLGSLRRRWRPWRKVAREGLKCQKEPPLARAARCTVVEEEDLQAAI